MIPREPEESQIGEEEPEAEREALLAAEQRDAREQHRHRHGVLRQDGRAAGHLQTCGQRQARASIAYQYSW